MLKKIQETRRKAYELLKVKQDRENMYEYKLQMEIDHEEKVNNKRENLIKLFLGTIYLKQKEDRK